MQVLYGEEEDIFPMTSLDDTPIVVEEQTIAPIVVESTEPSPLAAISKQVEETAFSLQKQGRRKRLSFV